MRIDSRAVMSVDLGTEYMKIAVVKPGVPMEIALNKESSRKTPVIVAIKGQDREFGEAALSRSNKIPSQSYMYLRELVGKSLDNSVIQQYIKRFPYYKLKTDSQTNELVFEHNSQTNYSIEELLAMILKKAREYATDFAEQSVDAVVITVPPYFTQSERRAIKRACHLANIQLLQLINDNTAVALHFGIYRRKDFSSTGSTYLFYDMGAQSTICTIATYSIVKTRDNGYVEDVPQMTIRSVAFDRDLGGLEFQIRLRDFLAKKFHEKHSKIDLFKHPKAMMKLFHEAGKAKHVLSANTEYTAQIEGLIDDIDFKHRITREEFEHLCTDLFERVKKPIENVLRTSNISLTNIEQVLLFGGSTRIPRVQNELTKALGGIELGKSLNTDEAAAMGAVYQAAILSKGYRLKKFLIKDANQYPINVQFERHNDRSNEKFIDRVLFDQNNLYPNRKSMTFHKHIDNFSFDIHYGNQSNFEQTNLARVYVDGVRTIYEKYNDSVESKGARAHFHLDESGILTVDRMEFIFEKKVNQSDTNETQSKQNEPSTLSKIGSKLSSFFSSKSSNNVPDSPSEESSENSTTSTANSSAKGNLIREPLKFRIEQLDYTDPTSDIQKASIKKLADLDAHDREIIALSTAKNNLESYIYDIRDKLEHDSTYKKASTSDERKKIIEKATKIDEWLGDEGISADVKTLKSKLDELKTVTKALKTRIREVDLRPKKLQELNNALNVTEYFLQASTNVLIKSDKDEEKPFTDNEVKYLDKLIKDTYIWRDKFIEESEKLLPTDTPKYLSTDIDEKIAALKRETNLLLTKAQRFVPKPKTTTAKSTTKDEKSTTEQTKTSSTDAPEVTNPDL